MEKNKSAIYLLYFVYTKFKREKHFLSIFWWSVLFDLLSKIYPIAWSFYLAKLLDSTIDAITVGGNLLDLWLPILVFLLVNLLGIFITQGQTFANAKISLWLSYWEDEIFLGKKIALEPKIFEDSEFMSKYNTMEWNQWRIFDTFQDALIILIELVAVAISLFALSQYSWILVLFAVLSSIPSAIITKTFGQKVWNIWNDKGDEKIRYSAYRWPFYTTDPESMQEISVFKYGRYLIDKMREINYAFIKRLAKTENKRALWSTVSGLVTLIFFVAAFVYSVNLAITGVLTVGMLTFVVSAYQQFFFNISEVFRRVSALLGNKKILSIFHDVQSHESTIKNGDIPMAVEHEGIDVIFENVWFKYPGTKKWVLKDINVSFNKDEDLAIVGKNGAGKTTLIKLLLRIYDPSKGRILIDGEDLKSLDIYDYYRYVGALTQSFNKLDIIAEDNIYIGNVEKEKQEENLIKAAKMADIDEVLSALPNGYKTFLNRELKDGATLSGGQWQKLAIARAFYRDAKLLILDEPTSAVDALSEEKIFDNIRENAKNKTTLIISHRFATVRKAKRIIVIDNGKIVEDGNHENLMKLNGLYANMYRTQVEKI